MKKRTRAGGQHLFLLELVVSILFFSLTGAVCVSLFAQAHELTREAQQRNAAVAAASSWCELVSSVRSFEELEDLIPKGYPQAAVAEGAGEYLAEIPLPEQNLSMTGSAVRQGTGIAAEAVVRDEEGKTVYVLTLTHYIRREGQP